jgi:hypothetical protein
MEKITYQTYFSKFYLKIFRLNLYRKNKKQGPQKKQRKILSNGKSFLKEESRNRLSLGGFEFFYLKNCENHNFLQIHRHFFSK